MHEVAFNFLCLREKPAGAMLGPRQHQPMSSDDLLTSALDDPDFDEVTAADLEDLYFRYTNNTVYVLDTADACGEVEGLVSLFGSPAGRALVAESNSENSSSSSTRPPGESGKQNGRLLCKSRRKERRKSSTELYREAAALLGLTCSMNDSCRCIECQSHYFDFDDDDRRTETGLAAGTPALLDHVLSHPMTCSLQ
ncbi:uncharacterized protein LOC110828073 [Zootermopsis nevadensis]|uniref:uncharacterized protein LOC110828073 n=1 Tax=Zootermopsis nevadensis TaxID=136037 RepID=UPI000B8E2D8A|nr:uncharacterized protein LOC110828073 [Zootermopsis nevadensis]